MVEPRCGEQEGTQRVDGLTQVLRPSASWKADEPPVYCRFRLAPANVRRYYLRRTPMCTVPHQLCLISNARWEWRGCGFVWRGAEDAVDT